MRNLILLLELLYSEAVAPWQARERNPMSAKKTKGTEPPDETEFFERSPFILLAATHGMKTRKGQGCWDTKVTV